MRSVLRWTTPGLGGESPFASVRSALVIYDGPTASHATPGSTSSQSAPHTPSRRTAREQRLCSQKSTSGRLYSPPTRRWQCWSSSGSSCSHTSMSSENRKTTARPSRQASTSSSNRWKMRWSCRPRYHTACCGNLCAGGWAGY